MIVHTSEDIKNIRPVAIWLTLIFLIAPLAVHCIAMYKAGGTFLLWLGLFFFPMGILHGYEIIYQWLFSVSFEGVLL